MSAPLEECKKERLCSMFDSFAKVCLRHTAGSLWQSKYKRLRNEAPAEDSAQFLFDNIPYIDIYEVEGHVLSAGPLHCVVDNEQLFEALLTLPENHLIVLLLDFWYECKDAEIAKFLGVTARTVYNYRIKAFKAIRREYEKKKGEWS